MPGKREDLLREIESQWPSHIRRGLGELVRDHPSEQIYVAAFWQFYCDYTVIHPPAFGANAESAADDGTRWQPAEWKWDVLRSVIDGIMPVYLELSEALNGATEGEWEEVIAAHYQLVPRVARVVTKAARERSGVFGDLELPKDFFVFAWDFEADAKTSNRLVRASVDAAVLPLLGEIIWPED
jgi:hypothetical protein